MEISVQEMFGILLAILILFVLPLYLSFESKDNVSYNLAVKFTTQFVNNVQNNGFVSLEMYEDYMIKMSLTGNVYDVSLEHTAFKYYPIIYAYNSSNQIVESFDYLIYKSAYDSGRINYNGKSYTNLKISFIETKEEYGTDDIIKYLSEESKAVKNLTLNEYKSQVKVDDFDNIPNLYTDDIIGPMYVLNKGDEFSVEIRNSSPTIAESIFNTFTVGIAGFSIPRIYVSYSCVVEDMRYLTSD